MIKINFDTAFDSLWQVLVLAHMNSGIPIPAGVLEKMKTPFFTTKSDKRHLGLGLAIVDGILRSHDGKLHIDSHSEITKISLCFPLNYVNLKSR